MLNKFIILIALIGCSSTAFADEVQVSPDNPGTYTVVKGDTLWDIAGRFLVEPWRWPEIWQANTQIADPHLIYPGDVISLSYQDGAPVLQVDRPGSTAQRTDSRTVKLSPAVRRYDRAEAIPTIPIDAIRSFLSHPLVVQESEIAAWPYVVSSYEELLIAGPGSRIYVEGISDAADRQKYSIYRQGGAYESNGELLGYEAIYVGEAILDEQADPSSLVVTSAKREVLIGDRLIPQSEADINTDIIPHQPATEVDASVISATDVLSEIGQYQVVVIDAGTSKGVDVGSVLGIYQSGAVITDPVGSEANSITLPEEYAGVLLVFRTFEQVSYGVIMEAINAIHLRDTVRNL